MYRVCDVHCDKIIQREIHIISLKIIHILRAWIPPQLSDQNGINIH